MRGIFLICFAAGFLSTGLALRAEATTLAASMHGESTALIERVTNICGANGCVRVQTQRIQHPKPGSVAGKHI
jgi:hypothetical protein